MNLSIRELNELIYSLGTTANKGMMCDKELNATLLDKLQCELNYRIGLEAIDEEIEVSSHYVSNEEADEDYRSTLIQDSNRYESSKKERGWVAQAILDYVDEVGAATFTEMNEFYKAITLGSNSFTHILQNLRVPYKNRKTQRYLAKEGRGGSNAKWVVKVANPSNWVVSDYDYKTFNEAPYGDN
jgi:hypothetical protein